MIMFLGTYQSLTDKEMSVFEIIEHLMENVRIFSKKC